MTLKRVPDGVRGQNQSRRGGARAGAGRPVDHHRRFAAAEVVRLTSLWGARRAAELVALAQWVNADERGTDALRDADFEVRGPSLWSRLCDRYRAGRSVTVASRYEGSATAHELRGRASALLKMVRRAALGGAPPAPRARRCRCLQCDDVHVHCHVCQRAWSLGDAETRAVMLSTGPTEHPRLPRVRSYCVLRGRRVLWTAIPERSDVGVLVCRACFRAAVNQLLGCSDPLRERLLAELPPVAYRLDHVVEGLFPSNQLRGLQLRGPRQEDGRVYVEVFGCVNVGPRTAHVTGAFDAPTLGDARANLRTLLIALGRRVAGRPVEASPRWRLGLVWAPT